MNLTVKPIGYVRSEHTEEEQTPIQPVFATECIGQIEVLPHYEKGLQDIEGFSQIIILYHLHKVTEEKLIVKPFLEDVEHGIFATRSPFRPNPIGISIVQLVKREGRFLTIRNVDMLDGTPVLDIKPYSSKFDSYPGALNGWMDRVDPEIAKIRGKRNYKKHGNNI